MSSSTPTAIASKAHANKSRGFAGRCGGGGRRGSRGPRGLLALRSPVELPSFKLFGGCPHDFAHGTESLSFPASQLSR